MKKGVLRNFSKFTGKQLSQALAQVFFCEFGRIFKSTFFYRTPQVAASVLTLKTCPELAMKMLELLLSLEKNQK